MDMKRRFLNVRSFREPADWNHEWPRWLCSSLDRRTDQRNPGARPETSRMLGHRRRGRPQTSTRSTIPSSRTRLVDEIRTATAFSGFEPLTRKAREAARAANDPHQKTKPKALARPACLNLHYQRVRPPR